MTKNRPEHAATAPDTAADVTSSPTSDNEGGEKPVREKLKKTSIDSAVSSLAASAKLDVTSHPSTIAETEDNMEVSAAPTTESGDSSRLRRKRSHEDVEEDDEDSDPNAKPGRHGRKRSRDNDAESPGVVPATDMPESAVNGSFHRQITPPATTEAIMSDHLTSPKGKRNRDQFLNDEEEKLSSINGKVSAAGIVDKVTSSAKPDDVEDERGAKRPRDGDNKELKAGKAEEFGSKPSAISTTSGFANSSSVSPFASLSGSKPADSAPKTSQSAFEASSFSKLAKSSTSPFGALGTTTGSSSPFGALASGTKSPPPIEGLAKTESTFGGSATTLSPFASVSKPALGSSFGGFGSGASPFGSALSGKSGLSNFGSGAALGTKPPIVGLSNKSVRPFGAPPDDDESDEHDDDEDDSDEVKVNEKELGGPEPESNRDKRFVEQDVETGEENERTVYSSRVKLYFFEKEWRERGVGTFKLNVSVPDGFDEDSNADKESTPQCSKARFIMRAEGSHRLILNTPFGKQTKFGDAQGKKPSGSSLLFHGLLEGYEKPMMLQIKMKAQIAAEFWEKAEDVRDQL